MFDADCHRGSFLSLLTHFDRSFWLSTNQKCYQMMSDDTFAWIWHFQWIIGLKEWKVNKKFINKNMMETLYFGIQEIFKEKLFCDVQLCFKHGSILTLHKLILASSSSFLLECLASQTSEETTCIILPDFDLHEFRYDKSVTIQFCF